MTVQERTPAFHEIKLDNLNSYRLQGYFQSPKYLNKYKEKILKLFEIPEEIKNNVYLKFNEIQQLKYQLLCQNVISLHVRRGDYLQLSHFHVNLSMDYYKKATRYFPMNSLYVIFSDDINWCKDNFEWIPNKIFIQDKDLYELYLMSMCDSHIIANSSFSWWGSYLNNKPEKKVICPLKWFIPDYNNNAIHDIYDENYIAI